MSEKSTSLRSLAALFIAGGLLMLGLLLAHPHPHEPLRSFDAVIEFEVRHQALSRAVHGSMLVVLVILLAGHVGLAQRLRPANLSATVAAIVFGSGCALLGANLVLDGLVVPALAVQFEDAKNIALQQAIQAQVQFCGICIRIVMPLALLAFASAAVTWALSLWRVGGWGRTVGLAGGAVGVAVGVMIFTVSGQGQDHVVLGGLFLIALWHLGLGTFACAAPVAPER
jgi:hypothetical protein